MKKSTTSKMKPSMMEGSSAAQMMKKFGGATSKPGKQTSATKTSRSTAMKKGM